MKFSKFLVLAGFAALLASCSQEEPLLNPNDAIPADIAENESFMYIGFGMASNGSRAAEPADETKTEKAEYLVANASLLIFKEADTEDDATFVTRIPFGSVWQNETDHADISRFSQVTLNIPANTFEQGASYSGIIVLNAPTTFTWPATNQTFEDWRHGAAVADFTLKVGDQTYMTMVSAPKYATTAEGGIKTLVHINSELIKKKESELNKTKPAAKFYVNRIAAKVTVVASETRQYTVANDQANGTITLTGWAADIKGKNIYPVQNTTGIPFDQYEYMHGTTEGFEAFPRCNWAATPSYSKVLDTQAKREEVFDYIKSVPADWNAKGEYVKPNCMDYMYQIKNRSTRVVIAANFKREGQANPISVYKIGSLGTVMTQAEVTAAVKQKTAVAVGLESTDNITVTYNNAVTNGGYYAFNGTDGLISSIKYKNASNVDTELTEAQYTSVAAALGLGSTSVKDISFYNNGVCYYAVIIRHFTTEDGVAAAPDFSVEGAAYEQKHLGRYGVLRNNWYEINVNTVANIGSPIIPEPTDEPDDKEPEKNLMNVDIYMLNWAKRVQNADL